MLTDLQVGWTGGFVERAGFQFHVKSTVSSRKARNGTIRLTGDRAHREDVALSAYL